MDANLVQVGAAAGSLMLMAFVGGYAVDTMWRGHYARMAQAFEDVRKDTQRAHERALSAAQDDVLALRIQLIDTQAQLLAAQSADVAHQVAHLAAKFGADTQVVAQRAQDAGHPLAQDDVPAVDALLYPAGHGAGAAQAQDGGAL